MKYKKGGSGTLRTDYCMLGTLWEGDEADALTVPLGKWYVSEKLDGMRAVWDGRGGLWSRYGRRIAAPEGWLRSVGLEGVKSFGLDGELWAGRGRFQHVMSVCRTTVGTSDWSGIMYKAFDVLPVGCSGDADVVGMAARCRTMFDSKVGTLQSLPGGMGLVQREYHGGADLAPLLAEVVRPPERGEGLMLRAAVSCWTPGTVRSKLLLKVKPLRRGSGTVVGVVPGKGRLVGMIGSLVMSGGFCLSGLTDAERRLGGEYWIGRTVGYKYREETDAGLPKEARYERDEVG